MSKQPDCYVDFGPVEKMAPFFGSLEDAGVSLKSAAFRKRRNGGYSVALTFSHVPAFVGTLISKREALNAGVH